MTPCPTPGSHIKKVQNWRLLRLGLRGDISSHLGGKNKDPREALG